MAGVKGRSGTNRNKDKPFTEALRMEISEAGDDHKALRIIARALVEKAQAGDMQAIQQVADRLDGKPHQTVDSNISHDIRSMTDDQIINRLAELERGRTGGVRPSLGTGAKASGASKPH